jgi:ATP-dependent RNA helicase RhlE
MIEVARRNSTVELTQQKVHPVDRDRKRELLSHLIRTERWQQVLVFTRTKHGANKLTEQLGHDGIAALAIHGNKSQSARTRALAEFKDGGLTVLVATDIAARGIDIDQLPHVVNYDMPNVPEDYVHRIGRTGRAGASGEAVSLVSVDERAFLRDIEKLIKRTIPQHVVPGFAPNPAARAQPIAERGRRTPNASAGRGTGVHVPPGPGSRNPRGNASVRGGNRKGSANLRTPMARHTGETAAPLPKGGASSPAPRAPGGKPATVHRFGGRKR